MSREEYEGRKIAAIEVYLKIVNSISEKAFTDLINHFDQFYNCKYKRCERYNLYQNSQCKLNTNHYNLSKPCKFTDDILNNSKSTKIKCNPELIEYIKPENNFCRDFLRINATWH